MGDGNAGDNNSEYWRNLLAIFLHDPPDKAFRISGHEGRAVEYIKSALGDSAPDYLAELREQPDIEASKLERLPMPKRTSNGTELYKAVEPEGKTLSTRHPLSGEPYSLGNCELSNERRAFVSKEIEKIVNPESDPKKIFLLLWRLLPGSLAPNAADQLFLHLPAETRAPDHTIWHHCDTAASFYPTYLTEAGKKDVALLSFHLGPVQEFIATARSLRDLWTGSMILSWLTFKAMEPVFNTFGPTAFIYPALRGLPFMDLWLLKNIGEREDLRREISSKEPCVPNKFLAVIPSEGAEDIARRCRKAALDEWEKIATKVKDKLAPEFSKHHELWDARWDEQIKNFFDIITSVMPTPDDEKDICTPFDKGSLADLYPYVKAIKDVFEKVGSRYKLANGTWQGLVDLSARLMEARRAVRHVPPDTSGDGDVPLKCSMMGSHEQMGPPGLKDSQKFWEKASKSLAASNDKNINSVRLRENERFCAISLVKRFAEPAYFRSELDLKVMFHDTASVAAKPWLSVEPKLDPESVKNNHGEWSGQWLHWPKQVSTDKDGEEEKIPDEVWSRIKEKKVQHGAPPAYYAILMMDADKMGKWLRGDNAPPVERVYHKDILEYIKGKIDAKEYEDFLEAKRPLGPAAHMAMSEALTNFAVHVVPQIVANHDGQLIYAGGDDVLAFLPLESAIQCARELRGAFRGEKGYNNGATHEGYYRVKHDGRSRDMLMMGPTATLSAGIAVVHYKQDLREALDAARKAEKQAKASGRNCLALSVMRRSGEHSTAVMDWPFCDKYQCWVNAFKNDASDRWAYHLRAELPIFAGATSKSEEKPYELPLEAMLAEIKRQLNRAEKDTRKKFGESGEKPNLGESAGDLMVKAFSCYLERRQNGLPSGISVTDGEALKDFITLVQSASFFARGRD